VFIEETCDVVVYCGINIPGICLIRNTTMRLFRQ
jgi:hypothetical protein